MRPLELVVSAFGPYREQTTINMDSLGSSGLYLITGDTGAGKTTIFDAICFALFGEPSGKDRSTSMLRSSDAEPSEPTTVRLTFEYYGKTYTIERNLAYTRPKARGTGETKVDANAVLIYPDGHSVSKTGDVNNAVRELLGVDRNQFSQIAMIAQGDFKKLITAGTEERRPIFRKVFKTEEYQIFEAKLQEHTTALKNRKDSTKQSLDQFISGIICAEDSEYRPILDRASGNEFLTGEVIETTEKIIEKDNRDYEQSAEELRKIEKALQDANTEIEQANSYEQSRKAYNDAVKNKPEAELKLAEAENVKKNSAQKHKDAEKLGKEIAGIEAQIPQYEEYDRLAGEIKTKTDAAAENEKQSSEKTKDKDKKEAELKSWEQELSGLTDVAADIERLNGQKREAEKRTADLLELKKELTALSVLKEKLEKAQKNYITKSDDFDARNKLYENLYRSYLDNQAGILARDGLKEGQKCPVCGSVHHPEPAKLSENAPEKTDVDSARSAAETARTANEEAGQQAAEAAERHKNKLNAVNESVVKLLGCTESDDVGPVLEQAIDDSSIVSDELKGELTQMKQKADRRAELENLIPARREEIKHLADEISGYSKAAGTAKAEAQVMEETRKKLESQLTYASKSEADEAKKKLENEKTALDQEVENAEKAFAEADKNLSNCVKTIETLESVLKNAPVIDKAAKETEVEELKKAKDNLSDKQGKIRSAIDSNTIALNKIKTVAQTLTDLQEEYRSTNMLDETVRGQLSGQNKIRLETYVQMHYLERIIAKANVRLRTMSDGQYEFRRREEAATKGSQTGLDLNVFDYYNGTERDVKSLSGGESFIAALSLALGLSDTIISSSGGVRLDSLFVDEGFGSLDENTLRQSMKALKSLSGANKLVGIISHVEELKKEVDRMVVVTKSRDHGSRVEII